FWTAKLKISIVIISQMISFPKDEAASSKLKILKIENKTITIILVIAAGIILVIHIITAKIMIKIVVIPTLLIKLKEKKGEIMIKNKKNIVTPISVIRLLKVIKIFPRLIIYESFTL